MGEAVVRASSPVVLTTLTDQLLPTSNYICCMRIAALRRLPRHLLQSSLFSRLTRQFG
jgi:hypothetical protein